VTGGVRPPPGPLARGLQAGVQAPALHQALVSRRRRRAAALASLFHRADSTIDCHALFAAPASARSSRAPERFTAAGAPLRLRALGSLDECEFRRLLRWLGRALAAAAGVMRQRDGLREAFVTRDEHAEEALFDIDHVRLADLKATPLALTDIEHPEQLLAEDYPPTEEGERARRRHRIARTLVEEPVLYVEELAADERDTYRSQRYRLEPELEELTGLQAERRAEGSALIDRAAALTDVRFPTRSTESLLALLLSERLRGGDRRSAKPAARQRGRGAAGPAARAPRAGRRRARAPRPGAPAA